MPINIYSQDLTSHKASELAVPYELVSGISGAFATKKVMISALTKAFDWDLEGCQAAYLAELPTEQKMAVEAYRADGSEYMNNALRTGRMGFKIDAWDLGETLRDSNITTAVTDVKSYNKSKESFVKKLYERSGLADTILNFMQNSVSESVHRWELLADMKLAVNNAPPRPKNTVLWRGEHFDHSFHKHTGLMEKTRHSHGETMKALTVGKTFIRHDFASFSMSPVVANRFAGRGCCIYRLSLPKNYPALFMESYTRPLEYEVILPPKTKFKVTKRDVIKSKVTSGAELVVYWLDIV
jgi:hypothetical protein